MLSVLLTSHERRDTTLACLERLHAQRDPGRLRVYLVDAGSRDGTAAAVAGAFPEVRVVERSADLFWCSGMLVAWEVARSEGAEDVLWLNDDTLLDPDAVARLRAADPTGRAIVVGATRDPDTGTLTYGGLQRPDRRRPLAFARVGEVAAPTPVETMNGNCVLVPAPVWRTVGLLDAGFTHAMGDVDYGLRARAAGVTVLQAPGTVGTCRANVEVEDRSAAQAWRRVTGVKGLPPREWVRFARRWAGPAWPLYAASPYVRRVLRAVR